MTHDRIIKRKSALLYFASGLFQVNKGREKENSKKKMSHMTNNVHNGIECFP